VRIAPAASWRNGAAPRCWPAWLSRVPFRRGGTSRCAPPERRLIGYDVSPADAVDVFDRLMMRSEASGEDVTVEVPGYRVDIEREVDLIEEVVRVQGYDRVGSTLPPVRHPGGMPAAYGFRRQVRGSLMRAGLREVRSFPFASDADLASFGDTDAIRMTNPLQSDDRWLRTRLLPGMLAAIRRNAYRQVRSAALFEVGTVFRMVEGQPQERAMAALAIAGAVEGTWTGRREYDFFDAKGAVEALMADLGIGWSLGGARGSPFHPGRSASILIEDDAIGVLGEIHPRVADSLDVPGRIAVAELEIDALMRHAAKTLEASDVPRFPPVRRDLSFVLDEEVTHAAVRTDIHDAGGDLVASCVLFDVHAGAPLPPGKKSLAFSVEFRDPSRTLEREEADEAVERIRARVSDHLGGELRGGGAEARDRPPV